MRNMLLTSLTILACAGAAAADWEPRSNTTNRSVGFEAQAVESGARLSGGCNRMLGPGLTFTLLDYTGGALRTIDDTSEPVLLEFEAGGATERFEGAMHHVGAEQAWVVTGLLPVAVMDALARGERMRLLNGGGAPVATFDLAGTSRLRGVMREVCGF